MRKVALVAAAVTTLAAADPAFDVASVKRRASGTAATRWTAETGRFTAVNVTLKRLISTAYGAPQQPLPDFLITGGPPWLATATFDITASAPGATPVQMIPMLRRLLEERFRVRAHFETRQGPIYSLVLVRKDGSLGPRMRRNTPDCSPVDGRGRGAANPCGGGQIFPGTLTARGASLTQIVSGLARLMPNIGRTVVDRTGLTGTYDIDLTWTPEQMPPAAADGAMPTAMPPIDPNGPSLFTALQEQWGLRLEPGTGPVATLVVDSATLPAED